MIVKLDVNRLVNIQLTLYEEPLSQTYKKIIMLKIHLRIQKVCTHYRI